MSRPQSAIGEGRAPVSEDQQAFFKRGRSFTQPTSWQGVLGAGAADVSAASKIVATAVDSKSLKVDPQLVDSMVKKLLQMEDLLADVRSGSHHLSIDTKLGSGYAAEISKNNTKFGEAATKQLADIEREIASLRTQIEKSRASYQNVDQAHADSLKKLDGKS